MNSTISKLYYGEISPCKEPSPNTKRYKETSGRISEIQKTLTDRYPDITDQLDELLDAEHIITALESEADFARGFRLGVLLMYDTLYNVEE